MKRALVIIAAIMLPLAIHAQQKVGGTGIDFLLYSPSIEANGMGQTGVARTDLSTYFFNPAAIAFSTSNQGLLLSFYPVSAKHPNSIYGENKTNNVGFALGLPFISRDNNKIRFGIAYNYSTFQSPDIIENSYELQPVSQLVSWSDHAHVFSVGATMRHRFDIAAGINLKLGSETFGESEADFTALDFGLLFKLPNRLVLRSITASSDLCFDPSLGISFSNYGTDGLPNTRRMGVAGKFAISGRGHEESQSTASLLLTYDNEKFLYGSFPPSRNKVGIELGLAEALYARYGAIYAPEQATGGANTDGYLDADDGLDRDPDPSYPPAEMSRVQKTYGFTIRSQGIARLLSGGRGANQIKPGLFTDKISLNLSFAKYADDGIYLPGSKFWGLTLAYTP